MKKTIFGKALTAVAALSVSATGALAADLTVVNGLPEKHVISVQGFEFWMECVSDNAGDDISFKYFPGGQIAKTKELLDAMNNGIADVSTVLVGYVSSKMPLNGVSMLPGLGSTATGIMAAYSEAVKSGPLNAEFNDNGIHPIFVMALPAYQIVSTKGALRNEADFSGKVIRSAGGTMNLTIGALGASAAEIPSSDMYVAMERGTIDATLSAYSSLKSYSVETLMNAASTNGEFGGFTLVMSMNLDKWNATPAPVQEVMLACGKETEASYAAHLDGQTSDLQAEFKAAGIDIYTFTPEELISINSKLSNVTSDWVKRLTDRGLPAAEVLESYTALIRAAN